MIQSRRTFLTAVAATASLGVMPAAARAGQSRHSGLAEEIVEAFSQLPGDKALEIWAPADGSAPEWSAALDPHRTLFCGSAFKAFVLAEFLRQIDSPTEELAELLSEPLALDEDVYSPSSTVFNPPHLSGKVTARTVLEAMISHSDNTATDMALKHADPDRVRDFIASIGLQDTRIPNSTRQFFGYIFGIPDWQAITWSEIVEVLSEDRPLAHPIINDVQTMVSSPHDFVSFYSRALQGEFFREAATLGEFRRILSWADAIALSMPLGVSAFMKGGSIDTVPEHALCVAGGMFIPRRWVYFALMINWTAESETDPETVAEFLSTARRIFEWVSDGLGE